MKRIVPTSTGYVAIDYSGKGWGDIETYDADGWKIEGAVWGMRGYPPDAAAQLARHTDLDHVEIERITTETDAQYAARGGDEGNRAARREALEESLPTSVKFLLPGALLAVVLLMIGLGILIAKLLL